MQLVEKFPNLCEHVISGGTLPDFCQLLQLPYAQVVEWIYSDDKRSKAYEKALELRGEWFIQQIIRELGNIAFSDISEAFDADGKLLPVTRWPKSLATAVQGLETEDGQVKRIRIWDKLKALELLGKNLSMFREQVDVQHTVTLEQLVNESLVIDVTE